MNDKNVSTLLAIIVVAAACGPAAGGDAEFWTPLHGAGGAPVTGVGGQATTGGGSTTTNTTSSSSSSSSGGGSTMTGGTGGGPIGPVAGDLSVAFRTVTFDGKYAPKNVVAVWVTDDQGTFVKTLGVFATKRIKYLVTWLAASEGNTVDAVTGATFGAHAARTVDWDSTGVDGNVVPDGNYRVHIEFTEQNKLGKFTSIPFTKGPLPVDLSPPDQPNFEDLHVIYAP